MSKLCGAPDRRASWKEKQDLVRTLKYEKISNTQGNTQCCCGGEQQGEKTVSDEVEKAREAESLLTLCTLLECICKLLVGS